MNTRSGNPLSMFSIMTFTPSILVNVFHLDFENYVFKRAKVIFAFLNLYLILMISFLAHFRKLLNVIIHIENCIKLLHIYKLKSLNRWYQNVKCIVGWNLGSLVIFLKSRCPVCSGQIQKKKWQISHVATSYCTCCTYYTSTKTVVWYYKNHIPTCPLTPYNFY